MIDLPATYARIVAKRPELEVIHLHWCEYREAEALILAHWLASLPHAHGVIVTELGWTVVRLVPDPRGSGGTIHVFVGHKYGSPLAALAAFWEAH